MNGYTIKELDGYTAEDLEEFEQMMVLEENLEANKRETQSELDFYKQPHTDEEWEAHARKEMLESDCPEEDLEKYFYYDSEIHEYVHNEEGATYSDNISRLEEMQENMFRQAISWGMPNAFPGNPFQDQEKEYVDIDLSRLQTLRKNGLSVSPSNSASARNIDTSYTIDGIKHDGCAMLYHGSKEIGVFYDDCSDFVKPAPHERHVEELLKIVVKHNIPLLLIFWDIDGKPTWEVYLDGKFVRQQYTAYSYDGYVYDRMKMSRMAELKNADIGTKQKALMELNTEARKTVYNQFEQDVRTAENDHEHAKLAEIVTKMQQKYEQLGFVFSQVNTTNDGLDEQSHKSVCAALDSFADTIVPGLAAAAYEEKAKKIYPFYSDVAASSQRYLRTAIALEEHLTEDHYDICPLYFELCRVFENELDIRIFSEYIAKLLDKQDFYATQWGGKEEHFKQIHNMLSRDDKHLDNLFIPEKIKVGALHMVNTDKDRASVFQKLLLDILKEKHYQIAQLEKESEYHKNCEYVTKRNKYVHPDDKLKAEDLHKELEKIKKQTRERMTWLINATDAQK